MNKKYRHLNKISRWISGVTCGVITGTAGVYSTIPACTGIACSSCPANCLSFGGVIWIILFYVWKKVKIRFYLKEADRGPFFQ